MRITRKSIYVMGAILWVILLISFVSLPFYHEFYLLELTDELSNQVEIPSPSKNIVVDVFNIDSGAAGANSTLVLIRRRSQPFDWRKNFCLLNIEGVKKTKIAWVGDAKLEIQYQPGVVYRAATEWNSISVTYSELK